MNESALLNTQVTPQLNRFPKEPVPENPGEKLKMVESLTKFGVSIPNMKRVTIYITM